jgi:hypothetical protein
VWNRAAWAVSYDVYMGTTQANMTKCGERPGPAGEPPDTYSWTPSTPLQSGTTYFWKVVAHQRRRWRRT